MLRSIKFDAEIEGASKTPYTKIEKEKWNFGIGKIENGKRKIVIQELSIED